MCNKDSCFLLNTLYNTIIKIKSQRSSKEIFIHCISIKLIVIELCYRNKNKKINR